MNIDNSDLGMQHVHIAYKPHSSVGLAPDYPFLVAGSHSRCRILWASYVLLGVNEMGETIRQRNEAT
jgi:hypothetical protein